MAKATIEHKDRAYVVIGGTSGIGLSGALALADAGARVLAVGIGEESVAAAGQALGDRGIATEADAREPETAETAIQRAAEAFGRIDGLYHVAGGSGRRHGDGALHEVTEEGIDYTLNLNLRSMILSNRAAVRYFLNTEQGGVILNVGSVLGMSPSPRFFATHVYAAAKAAIAGFTRSIASNYAQTGIRANVIAPGLVETPMSERAVSDPQIADYIHRKQPLDGGRAGRAEDLNGAVLYLLSESARFVTGQVLAVDGGWCVSEG